MFARSQRFVAGRPWVYVVGSCGRVGRNAQLFDYGEKLEPAAKASLGLIMAGQPAAERVADGVNLKRPLHDRYGLHGVSVPRCAGASRQRITLFFCR
jgi:hypothetical protein